MVSISVSGVTNDLNTIKSLVQRLDPVVAALPEVVGLIEAAISTFSHEDKAVIQQAYKDKMAKTDLDHKETQDDLTLAEATSDISDTDASPKGGGE